MFNAPKINCFSADGQYSVSSSSKAPGEKSEVSQLLFPSFSENSNSGSSRDKTAMPISPKNYRDTLFSVDPEPLKRHKAFEDSHIEQISNEFIVPENNSFSEMDIENDVKSQGKLYHENHLVYEGDIVDNKKHGKGTLYYPNCKVAYQGDFVKDLPSGEGKKYHVDGYLVYSGSFVAGAPHGVGTVFSAIGSPLVIGTWSKGRIVHGTKYFPMGARFFGSFVNGRIYDGKLYDASGYLMYQGQFSNEIANGFGTIFYRDGSRYEGMVINGRGFGQGRTFGQNNEVLASGIFENDQLVRQNYP